jgi:hypothetical protein
MKKTLALLIGILMAGGVYAGGSHGPAAKGPSVGPASVGSAKINNVNIPSHTVPSKHVGPVEAPRVTTPESIRAVTGRPRSLRHPSALFRSSSKQPGGAAAAPPGLRGVTTREAWWEAKGVKTMTAGTVSR